MLGEERDELPALAVQGAAFEEVVKLYLLKATRRVEALLVACADVAGRGLALGLGFGAFEDDDVAGHKSCVG